MIRLKKKRADEAGSGGWVEVVRGKKGKVKGKEEAKVVVGADGVAELVVGQKFIGAVGSNGKVWESMGKGFITVDSAAEESVCPEDWCVGSEFKAVKPGEEINLINASGGRINHNGERDVRFKAVTSGGQQRVLGLGFQV